MSDAALPGCVRAWTYRRQRLDGSAPSALDALHAVVAVYSSHPTGPLALLARCAAMTADEYTALEARREVVRIPAMRGSIFLVPRDTAPRVFSATRQPLEKLASRLAYGGYSWDDYHALKPRALELAREPLTPTALQESLGQAEGERLMTALRLMSYEGLLLRVSTSLRTDQLRYVAADAWLGEPLPEADPDEAFTWLVGAYLRGYGPARVQDIAWWIGAPLGRVRTALRSIDHVDIGAGSLLAAEQQHAFECAEPLDPDAIALLPKWDALTMGHAGDGRTRFLDETHRPLAYTRAGDGLPLLLHGGRAIATWNHRFTGQRLVVTVTPFPGEALPRSLDESTFAEVGRMLGAASVKLSTVVGG